MSETRKAAEEIDSLVTQLAELLAEHSEEQVAVDVIAGRAPVREVVMLLAARVVAMEKALRILGKELSAMRDHDHMPPFNDEPGAVKGWQWRDPQWGYGSFRTVGSTNTAKNAA